MRPVTRIRLRGLVTGRGLLGAPEGALQVADDVVSLLPGTIEPRKGYRQLQAQADGTTEPDPSDASGVAYGDGQVVQLRRHGPDHVLALHDTQADTSSLSTPVTLHPEGGVPMRSVGRRAYACTGAGVLVVENGAASEAGIPQALDVTIGDATGTLLAVGESVRYRVVYGDGANWGAPSGPAMVNTSTAGGAVDPVVTFLVDPALQDWWRPELRVRIYRSEIAASGVVPSDELYLVYEGPLPDVNPTFGIRQYRDVTPDAFLGPPLYVNAETGDGLGAAGANLPPPLQCSDVASWESRAWYAAHADNEPWLVQLVGVDGLSDGDIIRLESFDSSGASAGSIELVARATFTPNPEEFQVYKDGTPAQNVRTTAANLARSLCSAGGSPVLAWYVSGENDAPGMLALRLTPGAVAAGIVRVALVVPEATADTVPGMFSPRLPYTSTPSANDAQVLLDDSKPGRVRWSKPGQPEAVPALNEIIVGDAQEPIVGMVALRDGIVVAKTDGLYLIYGSGGMYGVQMIDASVRMSRDARRGGRGTVQELNNEVYLHASDQRVYACSAAGARAVDADVQDLLRHRESLFAATDERDGLYCLYLSDESRIGVSMTDVAVYAESARAWTRWLTPHRWASEWTAGGLVACSATDVLSVTRNDGQVTDYQDDGGSRTSRFSASDDGGRTQQAELPTGGIPGDEVTLVSDPSVRGTILFPREGEAMGRVLLHGLPFPVDEDVDVRVSACIRARVMLAPWHGDSPGGRKRFSAAQLHFDRYGLSQVGDGVQRESLGGLGYHTPWVQTQGDGDASHQDSLIPEQPLTPDERDGPWSTMYEMPVQPRTVRVVVPRAQQSAGMLAVGFLTRQANGFWRLGGVTVEVEQGEQRVAR